MAAAPAPAPAPAPEAAPEPAPAARPRTPIAHARRNPGASRSTVRPSERGCRVERREQNHKRGSMDYATLEDLDHRPSDEELRTRYGGGVYRLVDTAANSTFANVAGPPKSHAEIFGRAEEHPAVLSARAERDAARLERDAAVAERDACRVEVIRLEERLASREAEVERLTRELDELGDAVAEVEDGPPVDPVDRMVSELDRLEQLRARLAPPRDNPTPPPVDWAGLMKGIAPAIPGILRSVREALAPPAPAVSPQWAALEAAGLTPAQALEAATEAARRRAAEGGA